MTIGIAIPTYIGHIQYLERLLDSIAESTVLPKQVSISISETSLFPTRQYPFDIILSQSEDRRNPAENTNIALSKLSTDIFSIIGGDDMVHPQRNEFILWAFKNKDTRAVVHNILQADEIDEEFLKYRYDKPNIFPRFLDTINSISLHPISSRDPYVGFHNAMISFRKDIFSLLQYNERDDLIYVEDSFFTRDLVRKGIFLTYIENRLAIYLKDTHR